MAGTFEKVQRVRPVGPVASAMNIHARAVQYSNVTAYALTRNLDL